MPNDIGTALACETARATMTPEATPVRPRGAEIPFASLVAFLMTLTSISRVALALPLAALLSACGTTTSKGPETLFGLLKPYEIDVVQGNVVTEEVMAQVQPGLGRMQVKEILGTPLLTDIFHADRWDYVFTIHRPGVPDQIRRVSVFFKNDVVDHFDAPALPSENDFVASIDKPLKGDLKAPVNLTPEQIAKLPAPAPNDEVQRAPQGATHDYPPLESGTR
jgi:outer membrane protein assembly factor BamE